MRVCHLYVGHEYVWRVVPNGVSLNFDKILFHFTALLWESIILLMPPSTCKAYLITILLHDHCATYAPPPPTPTPYNIGDVAILCRVNPSPILYGLTRLRKSQIIPRFTRACESHVGTT